jgi:hypothetical protein
MFVLYELSTGRAHSQSSLSFVNPKPDIYGVKETALKGIWNEQALDFDPASVKRIIGVSDFIQRFTETEQELLISATKTSSKADAFVGVLKLLVHVDLDSDFILNSLTKMVQAGVLTQARALVIANG